MAKFIELPTFGPNKDTKENERQVQLVNMDRIICIQPYGPTVCRVTLAGGKVVSASRRYDTLSAQILGREDRAAVFPDEELAAAFEAGYEKAKAEINPDVTRKQQAREIGRYVCTWFEANPLMPGWQTKLRKDLIVFMEGGAVMEDDMGDIDIY